MQEAREIEVAYDNYKDEMADLTETVEIATLDKEMAEEKVKIIVFYLEHKTQMFRQKIYSAHLPQGKK